MLNRLRLLCKEKKTFATNLQNKNLRSVLSAKKTNFFVGFLVSSQSIYSRVFRLNDSRFLSPVIWYEGTLKTRLQAGDFCYSNSMQFLSCSSCNFKIARVNQVRFLLRFVAAISQGFRTCLKLDAILARQKLHRVAATKIACVNGP